MALARSDRKDGTSTDGAYSQTVALKDPVMVVAAVREWIEVLAATKNYELWDTQAKERFKDRFPAQLSNVSMLPDTVHHNIKLKDANKVMAAQSYACPKKYREA